MDLAKVLEALYKLTGRKLSVTLVTLIILAYINAHPVYIAGVGGLYTLMQGIDDVLERRPAPQPLVEHQGP